MSDKDDVKWLDAEQLEAFSTLMRVNMQLINKLDRQLRRDAKMSFYDYSVMSYLSDSPGRTLRMSELGHFSGGSLSRLSQVVARLEKNGWIERHPDPTDGRFTTATLTDAGYATVVKTAPGHVGAARRLVIDRLSRTQLRQMIQINRKLIEGIEAED